MKTRASKALGAAAGIAAIVASLPLAINAYADPHAGAPTPVAPIPDPQGPGCDAFKTALPNWKAFADQPVGTGARQHPGHLDVQLVDLRPGQSGGQHRPGAGQRAVRGVRADQRRRSPRWSRASSTPSRPIPRR